MVLVWALFLVGIFFAWLLLKKKVGHLKNFIKSYQVVDESSMTAHSSKGYEKFEDTLDVKEDKNKEE